jgi:Glycosyl transferase family 2
MSSLMEGDDPNSASTRSLAEENRRGPTVSVITPAYNTATFITETLESALGQTFTDFELIVVDDGSTDQTGRIAEQFALRDPRVRVLHTRNRGISAARNMAFSHARGALVALLDSDDIWFPTYLAEQIALLARHPEIDIISANAFNLGGPMDGQLLLSVPPETQLRRLSLLTLVQVEDSLSILAMFRRHVLEAIGGFDQNLRRSEDYDLWLRAARAGFGIAVNGQPLGLYRRRPDSISADEMLMLTAIRKPLVKLRAQCADRPDVQAAIDRQLARFAQRATLLHARIALLEGDTEELATHLSALAEATGAVRYRMARWLSDRAPLAIWWAYQCRRRLRQLRIARRRKPRGAAIASHLTRRAESRMR